jgi:signal transduction histidine kinase
VSFQKKLLVTLFVMILPLAVIGAQTLWTVREQTAALRRLERNLARARIFAEVESGTYRKIRKLRDYLSGQDPTARAQFQKLDLEAGSKLAVWRAATSEPADLELVRDYERLDAEIVLLAGRLFALYDDGAREQASRLLQEQLNDRLLPALDRTVTAIYTTSRTRNVQGAFDEVEAAARSTALLLLASLAACVLFSGLFSVVLARNLARPLEQLKTIMDQVGEGDFAPARALDLGRRDEFGDLARAFVRMAERLQRARQELQHKIDSLRETQSQLVQSEKLASLGQLAAAVAHGLRNPLASIRAAAQLGRHRLPPGSPAREQLEAVIAEVDRLEKRIVHLLDFARPVAFSPSPTSLPELVEGVVGVFEEKLSRQGVRLRLELESPLPQAWVDSSQIEQALIEVMANALEAMPAGGSLSVAARTGPARADASVVELSIADTGEGVPPGALPRVGEPFFTTKADGTGLGLSIAKRFVQQNHGEFAIANAAERGTLVTITLPVRREQAEPVR